VFPSAASSADVTACAASVVPRGQCEGQFEFKRWGFDKRVMMILMIIVIIIIVIIIIIIIITTTTINILTPTSFFLHLARLYKGVDEKHVALHAQCASPSHHTPKL
jgi:hypothetical protein